jgi:hypothetical protein
MRYPSFVSTRALVLGSIVALSVGLGCGESVDGDKFESVERVEMGLGPNGAVKGNATISFDANQYVWRHSDLHCVGSYEIDGDVIVAEMKIPCQTYGKTIRAKLDGDRLDWGGVAYRRVE